MARLAEGDAPLPPLIIEHLARFQRLVMPSSVSRLVRERAVQLAASQGLDLIEVPAIGGRPALDPAPEDGLVHGFPDVFGRIMPPPRGWAALLISERVAKRFVSTARPLLETGVTPSEDPARLAAALRALAKPLGQQRHVRPVFDDPPLLGLPFVAPEGVTLPGSFGVVDGNAFPGLPDLVVVRPTGPVPAGTPALDQAPLVVP